MLSRRVATTLAAAVLAALGACSKEVGNNAQPKPGVGAKIDHAIERTQEKLSTAGEKAKEDLQQATEKTQEALSRAGDKISTTTANAVSEAKQSMSGSPPYAPRQPVAPSADAAAGATAPGAGQPPPATTTTTLTTGPSTTVNITPAGR